MFMPKMFSQEPHHGVDSHMNDDINTGKMLPSKLFALIKGSYASFQKKS